MSEKRLSIAAKAGFGVCDLGGNLYFTVIAFWLLNFLTDTVHLSAALAGTVVLVGKIWDAITDPAVGILSDRTVSRWGRRRPWLLFGALPLAAAMIFMFSAPGYVSSQQGLFWWALIAYCLLGTAYTVVIVPYTALTPDLTQDYKERSSLNGYRFVFALVGTLLGAVAVLPIRDAFADPRRGYSVVGILFGAIMAVTALITFLSVREPLRPPAETTRGKGIAASYLEVFKSPAYLLITFAYVLHIFAITIVTGIMVYYYKYIFGDEAATGSALGLLLVVSIPSVPLSVVVSKKIGKKATYAIGLAILAVMLFVFYFAGPGVGLSGSLIIFALAGIGNGFVFPTPFAMVPDAIDEDYLKTGVRKEGAFYGNWTFLTKAGQGLAVGLMGWMLELSGFVENAVQEEKAIGAIKLLLGPVPAVFFVLAVIVLLFYPINEERYTSIRRSIDAREGAES